MHESQQQQDIHKFTGIESKLNVNINNASKEEHFPRIWNMGWLEENARENR